MRKRHQQNSSGMYERVPIAGDVNMSSMSMATHDVMGSTGFESSKVHRHVTP